MAFTIDVTVNFKWVGDGTGLSQLGTNQSNNPGFTATLVPGSAPIGQSLTLMVSEAVPGADSPTGANFNTALTNAATDLGTLLTTGGAAFGNPATPLSLIQGFSTGGA